MTNEHVSTEECSLGRRRSNIPSLVCAFLASATTGGTIYAFGIFANDLKRALHISEMQLGAISSAFFIAGLFTWIPGIVVDRMKMRFSMALGGIAGAAFTTIFWAFCRYPHVFTFVMVYPVGTLSILAVAICLSCGLIVGSIFKLTLLCGGPDGTGPSVGIAKGFVGLGSGIYATIFQAFRTEEESTLDFLPVIAIFFLVCSTIPALIFLPTRDEWQPHLMNFETTSLHFHTMYYAVSVLCLLVLGSAISDIWEAGNDERASKERQPVKILLVLAIWFGPILSILFLPRKRCISRKESSEIISEQAPLLTSGHEVRARSKSHSLSSLDSPADEEVDEQEEENGARVGRWGAAKEEEKRRGLASTESSHSQSQQSEQRQKNLDEVDFQDKNLNLVEMLQTGPAWVMLWITLVIVGSGTAKTNAMGQMCESLGFPDSVTPATLAIFSVAQAASRISTGIVSEIALQWKSPFPACITGTRDHQRGGVPRPIFLVIASCVALVAHVVLATTTGLVSFVIGCTISAIAFGMAWPLMVLIVGDVFGVEHHGANYMFYDGVTKALGTLLLSEYLSGSVYEAHASFQVVDDDSGSFATCLGPSCFRTTNITIAALAATCILASLILCYQTRHAYFVPSGQPVASK